LGLARVLGATRANDGVVGRRAVWGRGFVGAVFASRPRNAPPLPLAMLETSSDRVTAQSY